MWTRMTIRVKLKSTPTDDGIAHSKLPNFWTVTPSYTCAHIHMHGHTHMEVYTHNILATGYVPILKHKGSEAPI